MFEFTTFSSILMANIFTCSNCCTVLDQIPWRSLYAGTEPIVLQLDRIDVLLVEPLVLADENGANSVAAPIVYVNWSLLGTVRFTNLPFAIDIRNKVETVISIN